ncbi:MAG: ATP-dependent helicase [Actinomycetota bacterium]|nr:ATP-dependent helicase [Actinomycetota bacterium]
MDPRELFRNGKGFVRELGAAYLRYEEALFAENRVDFAHLQKLVHGLLLDEGARERIASPIRYVMVDEYQDTNYVQERVLGMLASGSGNLCVVGDEDQSLYRFRGATVRNILEFPERYPGAREVKLTTNYRSHAKIVSAYDRWMASADWENRDGGRPFRYRKTVVPDPNTEHPDYPAVFSVWGQDATDEASRFADMVAYLKAQGVVEDYSQVALLLHTVRMDHSGPYIEALKKKGIPAYCPRARAYFENEEVRLLVGAFAAIFGWHGEGRGDLKGGALNELAAYADRCLVELASRFAPPHPLGEAVRRYAEEIAGLGRADALDARPADYLYGLIAVDPFPALVGDENRARNLAIFSQLLNAFERYYHYTVVTGANRKSLRLNLFNSFLRLLHEGGINEYEDPEQPFPKGHVQVMTIHQAKGLEFPVVAVGSLDAGLSSPKGIDRDLGPFYHRPPFEPEARITDFDRMRLHYVAFSRPEKVLALTCATRPKDRFAPIWQGLPQWPYVEREVLGAQRFGIRERIPVKRRFSFTGDLKVYETCPRQYEFFREYDFAPSRSAVIFFGLLVHQTIEEVHRLVLDGELASLNEETIRGLFERTFRTLSQADVRPVGPVAKESAFAQVMNYFRQNRGEMERVVETEVDVSVEKEGYVLTGKVDLLMGADGKLELLDFKTSEKPVDSPELIRSYERQLATYAHILERRHGRRPERLYLYWTAEPSKEDALMELPYRPETVDEAGRYFDEMAAKIRRKEFRVLVPPEKKICKECDMKTFCRADGLIGDPGAAERVVASTPRRGA